MNAEFHRKPRRDKKAFLNDQCKEMKENNRMGKTRDLFKKIRDTMGTFHAKMGTISVVGTAAAKLLQWCSTLCNPIDGSPPGSAIPGIL